MSDNFKNRSITCHAVNYIMKISLFSYIQFYFIFIKIEQCTNLSCVQCTLMYKMPHPRPNLNYLINWISCIIRSQRSGDLVSKKRLELYLTEYSIFYFTIKFISCYLPCFWIYLNIHNSCDFSILITLHLYWQIFEDLSDKAFEK